jgi:hypothetical protein
MGDDRAERRRSSDPAAAEPPAWVADLMALYDILAWPAAECPETAQTTEDRVVDAAIMRYYNG